MSEQQSRWTGENVAGRYLLGKYLGGTDHSAVFSTEIVHARSQQVAIKLIPAAGMDTELQLARWKSLSAISHPNLLKILDYGKCELEGALQLFVVMEYANEDLADILPERALNVEETRGMMEPLLETLAFLHGEKLVHTRLHPGNVLATGDQIKLSNDSIVPEGETIGFKPSAQKFSAPEAKDGVATATEDIWSFGATVVAALTQKAPVLGENGEATVPGDVPEPFLSICCEALKQDPTQRIPLAGIRARLNPASVAAAAPLAIEVSKTPPIDPVAVRLSTVAPPRVSERRRSVPGRAPQTPAGEEGRRSYWLPIAALVVVAILLFSVPKLFRRAPSGGSPVDAATNSLATEKNTAPKDAASKTSMTMPKKSPRVSSGMTDTAQPALAPMPASK